MIDAGARHRAGIAKHPRSRVEHLGAVQERPAEASARSQHPPRSEQCQLMLAPRRQHVTRRTPGTGGGIVQLGAL